MSAERFRLVIALAAIALAIGVWFQPHASTDSDSGGWVDPNAQAKQVCAGTGGTWNWNVSRCS